MEQELTALGVPAGVVMSVPDILAHPHIAHRGVLAEFKDVPVRAGLYLSCAQGFRQMVNQQRLTHRRLLSASIMSCRPNWAMLMT